MAQQHTAHLSPQQHSRIAHILELLPSHHRPPPAGFPWIDGKSAAVDSWMISKLTEQMRSEVRKLVAIVGEAVVAVDGIVSLEVCLSLAQVAAWMRMPACSQLTGLNIWSRPPSWSEWQDVTVEGWEQGMEVFFAALAQLLPTSSPHQPKRLLSKLRLLDSRLFGRERVCGHLAQHLLTTASWLETLTLNETDLRSEGIAHIADALQTNTTLKSLLVWHCPKVGDAGVEHLSAMLLKNATLQALDLRFIGMTGHGLGHLCRALSSSSSATTLKVLSLHLRIVVGTDVAGGHVGNMLSGNASLERLTFHHYNAVEDKEGRIGKGLRNNRTLKELDLQLLCEGRATDLKELFAGIASNTTLNTLKLLTTASGIASGMLLPLTAPELGTVLAQNCSLQKLEWTHQEVEPYGEGIEEGGRKEEGHFAQAFRNNSALQVLHIPARVLGQRGLEHLFASLATYNTTLRELNIPRIMSGGVHELALMLSRNRSLQKLDIPNSGYSAHDWATSILPALADNQGLKEINCDGCRGIAGDEVLHALNNLLRINTRLEEMNLHLRKGLGSGIEGELAVVNEELKQNKAFRATLSTVPSAKPRSCRIVLCGKEYAGKSTLLRTLKRVVDGSNPRPFHGKQKKSESGSFNPHNKELGQRTRGIDIQLLKDTKELRMLVWDFAGHQEYHALHDLIFPGMSNAATVFVFACSPVAGPTERCPGDIKRYEQMKEELLYWLRFIVSNMKPHHSVKPTVVVLVTHRDHVEAKYTREGTNRWVTGVKSAFSKLIADFKFNDVVSMPLPTQFVDAQDGKDVQALLPALEKLCKEKLELMPKQPVICEKVCVALQDMEKLQAVPIITTQAFQNLCNTLAPQKEKTLARGEGETSTQGEGDSQEALFAEGDRGWRAVAAYLDSAGEIMYHSKLNFIVTNPKWFGHGILGQMINIFAHEDEGEEGIAPPRSLFTCCFGATSSNVAPSNVAKKEDSVAQKQKVRVELPKNGLVTRDGLKELLAQALKIIPGPDCVVADDLVELMKAFNLCFEVNPGNPNTEYLIPAIFDDDVRKLAATGRRELKWAPDMAGSCCIGRRLECADRARTFLTAGFFPRLQVILRNKAVDHKWVTDGNSSNCSLETYLFKIVVNGMQIFVEYGGFAGYFVDILVKSSQNNVETLQFVQHEIIDMIRSFCASPKGCPGVTLAESVIRPGCVSGLTLCAYRSDQAVRLEELRQHIGSLSNYKHNWSDLEHADGTVILAACADDDVSASAEILARIQYGRVVPLMFHIKCECKGNEHEVDQQPGRNFYLVDHRFATGVGILNVMAAFAKVAGFAAKVGGYVVPGVGVAGDVLRNLPTYKGTPVYPVTIESLMRMRGSTSSGTLSDEQLRSEVERDLQGSRAGPWMDAFLKLEDFHAFSNDFRLVKVVYKDNSATGWLCETHLGQGQRANTCQKFI